jgi:hypothetical protein
VLAGHSLHWFDMDVAGPEIARVLVPGGIPAGLWNVLDNRIAWVAGLGSAGGPPKARVTREADGARRRRGRTFRILVWPPRFDSPERAEFPHGQRRTVDSLVDALATRAGVLVMSEQEREATLSCICAFLAGRQETTGEFDLPILTGVLRVRRS